MRVAGIMSGTSLDGIDVADRRYRRRARIDVVAYCSTPYPDKVRKRILAVSNTDTHTRRDLAPELPAGGAVREGGEEVRTSARHDWN